MRRSTRTAKQEILRNFMERTIAQSAKEVFAERGYQRATLEEIAQRAGMSKATIYLYYRNKDDLFLHVVEDLVNRAIAATAQEATTARSPLEKLYDMVRSKVEFYEQERAFFRIYLNEKQGLEVAPKTPTNRPYATCTCRASRPWRMSCRKGSVQVSCVPWRVGGWPSFFKK
jgi:AcrR family transcriptional regulator